MEWLTTSTILAELSADPAGTAWRRLVERFRTPIVEFARRFELSRTDAEDVAQEALTAFTCAYRAGGYQRERGPLRRWLFGFAYRQALRQRERRMHAKEQSFPGATSTSFIGDDRALTRAWDDAYDAALLRECLDALRRESTLESWQAFDLTVLRELAPANAAAALGMTVKSVYNAKHRLLGRLRELFAQIDDDRGPDEKHRPPA